MALVLHSQQAISLEVQYLLLNNMLKHHKKCHRAVGSKTIFIPSKGVADTPMLLARANTSWPELMIMDPPHLCQISHSNITQSKLV